MTLAIQPIGRIRKALVEAKTPEESKAVEAMAAAAQAWAKEQKDYELLVASTHAYICARRQ